MRRTAGTLFAVALTVLTASPLLAQGQGKGEIAVTAGPSSYDLSGTGTSFAGRASLSLAPGNGVVVIEPSFGYFRYDTQGDASTTWILPEVAVQLRARGGAVRPYIGAGAGIGFGKSGDFSTEELTLHAAVGARVPLSDNVALRAEMRVRSVDPWAGSMVDFGFGFGWRAF